MFQTKFYSKRVMLQTSTTFFFFKKKATSNMDFIFSDVRRGRKECKVDFWRSHQVPTFLVLEIGLHVQIQWNEVPVRTIHRKEPFVLKRHKREPNIRF